jgi:DNA-binding IclR family transcriptional regulator
MARGFVERVENDGRYRANLRQFLTLSGLLASVGEQNWIALAQIQLNELSTTLGRSANLCMPTGTEMVYLFQILPGEGIAVNSPPGTRRPLHCSAVGKAYLGGLPVAECNEMATTLRYMKRTPTTILSARALLHDLAQGRQHGYYVDDGEWDSLINCVAAPILDRTDRPIASIGVTGVRASGPITPAVGASVNKAARLISMAIGHHESRVSSEAQG